MGTFAGLVLVLSSIFATTLILFIVITKAEHIEVLADRYIEWLAAKPMRPEIKFAIFHLTVLGVIGTLAAIVTFGAVVGTDAAPSEQETTMICVFRPEHEDYLCVSSYVTKEAP